MKKSRIRIHKNTLNCLNNPQYIALLINPQKKIIAIKRCNKKKRDTVKINYSSDKDCEVYSLDLLLQIAQLEDTLLNKNTVKLYGQIYKNEIIEFNFVHTTTVS